jgi:nitrogen fixation/metabolism regulation signal transduction histidine kinase
MQKSKVLFDLLKDLKASVIALDSELNISDVNNSQVNLFGIDSSQLIGKNISELDHKVVDKIFNTEILKAISRREISSFEWKGVHSTDLWQTTIFPVSDGLAMISRNVSSFNFSDY